MKKPGSNVKSGWPCNPSRNPNGLKGEWHGWRCSSQLEKRKEKKRLQKLTANVGEDVCWRRGNGLMAHALVDRGTEITDPKLPKNWTSAVRWTGDSVSAPRTCAVPEERRTCMLAYRCCWCWEVDDLVCPYQILKRRQRPRWWGQGGCVWSCASQQGAIWQCLGEGAVGV